MGFTNAITSSSLKMLLLFTIYFMFSLPKDVQSVAVMSVDLGSEWMKVAIVSPGVPMEIALNTESKRKTPMAVAFRGNERLFGEDALSVGVRFPSNCYTYFIDLIGKQIDNPVVMLFKKRFPYYNIVSDPVRGTVLFQHDNDTLYSPEELVGMMLHKAKQFAEESAFQSINEVVLTVPGYFNQVERKSILTAAEFADLKVLQLINDYTATALTYGIFRTKDINETAQYVMLFDMGAYSTSVAIVGFQVIKTKDKGYVESTHQLSIIGVGFDRTLGGIEMQLRLRDHLAMKFNSMKKTTKDVLKNPRAMAKLFKEAGRLKNVLSANTDHYAQIEGLIDDIDFKAQVTREEFENMCADLFARVKNPIEQSLKYSGLSIDVINQVILVGAGTRVPAVQQALQSVVKVELSKNLNTDEAAVMGAVYKAADLSKGFKVKKFITKDAVLFPIQVQFGKEGDKGGKLVKRTLFGLMNPYPQKKLLTFNKHQNDFSFVVHYGDLEALPEQEINYLGPASLYNISLKGVNEAIKKHQGDNIDHKGIKVHFTLDESGILSLTGVEYVIEKTLSAEELQKESGESTFSKISNTISKLFHAAEEELKQQDTIKPVHEVPSEEDSAAVNKTASDTKDENSVNNDTNTTESVREKDEQNTKPESESKVNGDKPPVDKTAGKLTKTVIKQDISSSAEHLAVPLLTVEQFNAMHQKIKALNEYDLNKRRYDSALNALEAAIIETHLKMDSEFQPFATVDEQESITKKCDQLSAWLEEESYSASADVLESKLNELKTISKPVENRFKEYQERHDMVASLEKSLNYSSNFLLNLKNLTETLNKTKYFEEGDFANFPYTATEIETLEKLINNTMTWKEKTIKEQEALPKSQDPILTSSLIKEKLYAVDREVRYLINKSRTWKPPPSSSKKDESSKTETTKSKEKSEVKDEKIETTRNETEFAAGTSEDELKITESSKAEDIPQQINEEDKIEEVASNETAKEIHTEL